MLFFSCFGFNLVTCTNFKIPLHLLVPAIEPLIYYESLRFCLRLARIAGFILMTLSVRFLLLVDPAC